MTTVAFQTLAFAYQVADVFAFLVLAASGLAIIFGMMGVINMAHGEFITCGAYVTTATARRPKPTACSASCSNAPSFAGSTIGRSTPWSSPGESA